VGIHPTLECPHVHLQLAGAKGYAMFWLFLASVAIVSSVLSWWILKGQQAREKADS
jgi:hypothetical protein